MIGGSIDMLATGAVISNFPARGQGKMFLVNDVEFATAQLWVRDDQGIKSFADLKGKQIATTTGTTAHVFLDKALRANKVDPKEVELVNQRMPEAVTSFISGAVPAVALWVPFNITVRDKVPGAETRRRVGLLPAGGHHRRLGGGNDYYEPNKETLANLIKGWAEANDYIIANPACSARDAAEEPLQQMPLADLKEQFKAQKMFTSQDWKQLYADGTVTNWLQQATDFFMANAGIKDFTPASKYFDPEPLSQDGRLRLRVLPTSDTDGSAVSVFSNASRTEIRPNTGHIWIFFDLQQKQSFHNCSFVSFSLEKSGFGNSTDKNPFNQPVGANGCHRERGDARRQARAAPASQQHQHRHEDHYEEQLSDFNTQIEPDEPA